VLTVADGGPGIPDDALARLVDRFSRADPSRSRRSGGSGLGLAIVEAIVTAHGGTVAAENAERTEDHRGAAGGHRRTRSSAHFR